MNLIGSGDYAEFHNVPLKINMSSNVSCVSISTVYDNNPMNMDEVFSVLLSSNDPAVFIPKERASTLVTIENSTFNYNYDIEL